MRSTSKRVLFLAILVPALAWAAAAGGDRDGVRGRIEEVNKTFVDAVARGDAARLASLYSSSAQVLPPESEPVQGREAIQGYWRGVLESGVKSAELSTVDVAASGDLACETGTYVMKDGEGKVLDRGKYLVAWRREEGTWRIFRDIWNTSLAPPAK